MSTQSLKGKKAMVIGGSRGIGAAVVKRLAREGAAVAFTYVSSRAAAEALATSIEDAGGHATALHADSADAQALDVAVDRAAEALGGLDVLVNNAGILIHGNVADYSLADFDKMIAVNVRGVFVAAKAAARHLPPGGKMIVIGSNTARRAWLRRTKRVGRGSRTQVRKNVSLMRTRSLGSSRILRARCLLTSTA